MIAEEAAKDSAEAKGQKESLMDRFVGFIEDHLALLSLELKLEAGLLRRRLLVLAAAALTGILAVLCIQVSLVVALLHQGVPLTLLCAVFGAMWAVVTGLAIRYALHRDQRFGPPLTGSRSELRRSLQWIRQHTS